jgi:hypothetical protein
MHFCKTKKVKNVPHGYGQLIRRISSPGFWVLLSLIFPPAASTEEIQRLDVIIDNSRAVIRRGHTVVLDIPLHSSRDAVTGSMVFDQAEWVANCLIVLRGIVHKRLSDSYGSPASAEVYLPNGTKRVFGALQANDLFGKTFSHDSEPWGLCFWNVMVQKEILALIRLFGRTEAYRRSN